MLDEAASEVDHNLPERPLKRRRVNQPRSLAECADHTNVASDTDIYMTEAGWSTQITESLNVQTAEQSSDDESDLAFEDIDLELSQTAESDDDDQELETVVTDVSVSVNQPSAPARRHRGNNRNQLTAAEKSLRLMVHKAHYLCLVAHCMFVNGWCNNAVVHRHVRLILSERTMNWFNDKSQSQAARHLTFIEALQKCGDEFSQYFNVTVSGMHKANWTGINDLGSTELVGDLQDLGTFISAAKYRRGSQDTGNQLFCALLRSIGIEARLVCSLQILPFGSVPGRNRASRSVAKNNIHVTSPGRADSASVRNPPCAVDLNHGDNAQDASGVRGFAEIGTVPSIRRRLGRPAFGASAMSSPQPPSKRKEILKLSFPVWWVEAFDEAYQRWIPVDPIVTRTVNKATKLQPPSTYHDLNQLVYVIAMETNGVAKDVTRRYAKAYNAKTRRFRLDSTEHGTQWLGKAMKVFRTKSVQRDRDQVEDIELSQKEAKEGLPENVQDFKGHPRYALERHLKRHEVLHPRREVGRINAGTAAKPKMEAVFRRQDVLLCRSAEKWFRLGREVKAGQQPLKHIDTILRSRHASDLELDQDTQIQNRTTALYSFAQTMLYIPLPVIRGRIPRNAFGNLDVYVPSMVPEGGIHLRHPFVQQAARLLRVDHADAVTGFQFRNRKGVAVIEGAVVPAIYAEAVKAVIDGMDWLQQEDSCRLRSLAALRLWKKFFVGLNIRQKVDGLTGVVMDPGIGPELQSNQGSLHVHVATSSDDQPLYTAGRYTVHEVSEAVQNPRKSQIAGSDDEDELLSVQDERQLVNVSTHPVAIEEEGMHDLGGGFIPYSADEESLDYSPNRHTLGHDVGRTNGNTGGGFLDPDEAKHGDDHDEKYDGDNDDTGTAMNDTDEHIGNDRHSNNGVEAYLMAGHVPDGEATHSWQPRKDNVEDVRRAPGLESLERDTSETADDDRYIAKKDDDGIAPPTGFGIEFCPGLQQSDLHVERATGDESRAPTAEAQVIPENPKITSKEQEESDRGSLLSHDPDDEDAEPDWLESD
nr:dna repair protein rhp41 [Quercus suber]